MIFRAIHRLLLQQISGWISDEDEMLKTFHYCSIENYRILFGLIMAEETLMQLLFEKCIFDAREILMIILGKNLLGNQDGFSAKNTRKNPCWKFWRKSK